jgi:hypothetical protein
VNLTSFQTSKAFEGYRAWRTETACPVGWLLDRDKKESRRTELKQRWRCVVALVSFGAQPWELTSLLPVEARAEHARLLPKREPAGCNYVLCFTLVQKEIRRECLDSKEFAKLVDPRRRRWRPGKSSSTCFFESPCFGGIHAPFDQEMRLGIFWRVTFGWYLPNLHFQRGNWF